MNLRCMLIIISVVLITYFKANENIFTMGMLLGTNDYIVADTVGKDLIW